MIKKRKWVLPETEKRMLAFWNSSRIYFEMARAGNIDLPPIRRQALSFIAQGDRVLDVACGSAENLLMLKPPTIFIGIDYSTEGLLMARELPSKTVSLFIRGDVTQLPFGEKLFDTVLCTYSLEHFSKPRVALYEMFRVLKSGGKMIIIVPAYDLPVCWPPHSKGKIYSLILMLSRFLHQFWNWLIKEPYLFQILSNPDVLDNPYSTDNDVVYLVWSREILSFFQNLGCEILYLAESLPQPNKTWKRILSKLLMWFPLYKDARDLLFVVLRKSK